MAIPLGSVGSVGVQPRSTAVALLRPLAAEARQALLLFPQCSAFHRLGSPSSSVRGFSSVSSSSSRSKNRLSVSCQKQQQQAIDGAGVVTESDWDKLVLESDVPVLVDFWAPWCGPCRMIETIVDDLAREYYGRVRFFKLNTDEYPNIATRYGIRSIPTVMIFNQGDKKDTVIGAVPKTTLVSTVEKYLQL